MINPELRFKNDNSDWESTTLGNIGTLKNGYSFKSNLYTKDSIFNVLTISNVQGNRYIAINDSTNKYPYIPNDISSHQVLKENDILISLTGNVGRVSLNKGKFNLLNQRVGLFDIQNNKYTDKLYIFELMHSKKFENTMILQGQGAAQLNISKGDIENYKIKIPTIEVQQEISSLLSNIDNKISNEELLIKKLKNIKSSLLNKMFPQEGQSKPDLRFKNYSDPWNQRKLKDIVYFLDTKRKPLEGAKRITGPYPYYGASGVVDYVNGYLFNEELILLSEDGANITDRNYPVCFLATGKFWVNNHAHVLKTKNEYDNNFICNSLERKDYTTYNTGMAMPKLNQEVCKNIPIISPKYLEQKQIGDLFRKLDNLITLHHTKI